MYYTSTSSTERTQINHYQTDYTHKMRNSTRHTLFAYYTAIYLLRYLDVSTCFISPYYPYPYSHPSFSNVVSTRQREYSNKNHHSSLSFQSTLEKASDEGAIVPASNVIHVQDKDTSRLQRLKDRMWARETLEDLTTAEFACSLDAGAGVNEEAKDRKRAVDFEALVNKLDRRLAEMCVKKMVPEDEELEDSIVGDQCMLPEELAELLTNGCDYSLVADKGMGSVVYSTEQRDALFNRIVATRIKLQRATGIVELESDLDTESSNDLEEIRRDLNRDTIQGEGVVESVIVEQMIEDEDETVMQKKLSDPIMYVRDDGTIDWDGALQNREALSKFGTAVWARINGQNPEMVDDEVVNKIEQGKPSEDHGQVTAKVIETQALRAMKRKLDALKDVYIKMEVEHTALLNSGVSPGTAIANVNLATLDPNLRTKIRESSLQLEQKKDEVSFLELSYELERIFVYLEGEIGNISLHGYIPLQDRLAVAEFGLLESQVNMFNKSVEDGDIIDADVLAVVIDQVIDLKRRLGIDYYVTGLTYDREAIQRWLSDLWVKIKRGAAFYGKGCVLLWNDIAFCLSLFSKAAQGYTLKPREVRTVRRTFKDIITFIPVVIILIIPLTPIGHVFVFGAIQRFFPDFFPSCFTERRQNLLQLYESTEYSELTIKESWKNRVVRAFEALAYVTADSLRKLIKK